MINEWKFGRRRRSRSSNCFKKILHNQCYWLLSEFYQFVLFVMERFWNHLIHFFDIITATFDIIFIIIMFTFSYYFVKVIAIWILLFSILYLINCFFVLYFCFVELIIQFLIHGFIVLWTLIIYTSMILDFLEDCDNIFENFRVDISTSWHIETPLQFCAFITSLKNFIINPSRCVSLGNIFIS